MGGDVGNIAYPDFIGLGCEELTVQQIGGNGVRVLGIGGGFVSSFAYRVNVCLLHQAVNSPSRTSVIRLKQMVYTIKS